MFYLRRFSFCEEQALLVLLCHDSKGLVVGLDTEEHSRLLCCCFDQKSVNVRVTLQMVDCRCC